MTALAQGGASSVALPRVTATWIEEGFLADLDDVDALEFRLVDSTGVEALAWTDTVTELGVGRYVLEFTLPGDAELGVWTAEWRAGSQSGATRFRVVLEGEPIPDAYATVSEFRDEGVPVTFSDQRLATALERASREIDQLTRRQFGPRFASYSFNGTRSPICPLDREVVGVELVTSDGVELDNDSLIVTNDWYAKSAHKIEWRAPNDRDITRYSDAFYPGTFAEGRGNITISGLWGYVEAAPWGDLAGQVPTLIVEATLRLAARRVRRSWSATSGQQVLGPIASERTREQAVTYAKSGSTVQTLTGDPEVDRILSQYRRGFIVGVI